MFYARKAGAFRRAPACVVRIVGVKGDNMRLSFTKKLCILAALSFFVAAVCLVCLFVAGTVFPTASADTELIIDLGNYTCMYGDRLSKVDDNGYLYGTINGTNFTISDTTTRYYVKASEIMVARSARAPSLDYTPVTYPLCNNTGLVDLDVYDSAVGIYNITYYEAGIQWLFSELKVYDTQASGNISNYFIACVKSNDELTCRVSPRAIEVAYNAAASHAGTGLSGAALTTQTKDGVLYIQRTYGAVKDTIAFAEAEGSKTVMSAFGDALTTQGVIVGNDATTHVGYYEIESLDLVVKRGETDVSNNYSITSARAGEEGAEYTGYGVRVLPREVAIGSFEKDSKFTTVYPDFGVTFDSHTFTTQAFRQDAPSSGVTGQTVSVYYDVITDPLPLGLWDVDAQDQPREGVVAISSVAWPLSIVGWTVSCDNPAYTPSALDYTVKPANEETTFGLTVSARPIVLYDTAGGGVAGSEGEWVDVVANHIEISLPYGELYDGNARTHALDIDGTMVTLSFEVQYEGQSLGDYLTAQGLESIRLDAGFYDIINPEVTDNHYIVTVHDSVRWTVTKRQISYQQLLSWLPAGSYAASSAANATAQEKAMYNYLHAYAAQDTGICVGEFAYDAGRTEVSTTFRFEDADLQQSVAQAIQVAATTPGYYAVQYDNANYAIAEDTLYVRVQPVQVLLSVPQDCVYNAQPYTVGVAYEGQEDNPFDNWQVNVTYRLGTQSVALPTDAGTYTVVLDISETGNTMMQYNPYLTYTGVTLRFTIAPCEVEVRLTNRAATTKRFGDGVSVSSNWYNVDGLLGDDSVSLTSAGFDAEAVPDTYPIRAAIARGNAANYNLVLKDAAGDANPAIRVDKLTAEEAKQYFDEFIRTASLRTGVSELFLPTIRYNGLTIGDIGYSIAAGDDVWSNVEGTTATGLEEGAKYYVRVVIRAGSRYVDTRTDIQTIYREAVTDITPPVLSQDVMYTTGRSVMVVVDNFDATMTYLYVAYVPDEEAYDAIPTNLQAKTTTVKITDGRCTIPFAYSMVQVEGEEDYEWQLGERSDMTQGSTYQVVLVVKTTDRTVVSEPLTVRTRTAAPAISTSAIGMTSDSVSVPDGYYIYVAKADFDSALPVASVVSTTMQEAGLTFAMLAESGASLDDNYIESVTEDLEANTAYVLAIWSMSDDMPSDVQCFMFKTRVDESNRFRYSGVMLLFSRYLLVGLLALMVVLFIVCTVRYAVLKKKLGR